MKRLMIISLFLTVFATGCFFYEEAETVNPADVTSTNTGTAPGGITTFTATVTGPTLTNKTIIIEFDSPASAGSIIYDTSIIIERNSIPLVEGVGYNANPVSEAASVINISLTAGSIGDVFTVTLTSGITAYTDTTITLTPYTNNYTL